MGSYQRMLVHRCAAYFGMQHNIEGSSGKYVVVNKTKNTRIPEVSFQERIKGNLMLCEEQPRRLLQRDSNSVEDYSFKSSDRQHSFESRRSKSFEEREEQYKEVRRRIFNIEVSWGIQVCVFVISDWFWFRCSSRIISFCLNLVTIFE